MVHELFHVDAHWEKYAPGNGHVKDIKFTVKKHTGNNFYQNVERKAYGPYYTKVLARLDKFAKAENMLRRMVSCPNKPTGPGENN